MVKLADIQRMNATKRLQVGDKVQVGGRARVVMDTTDPALITLKTASGAQMKVGRLALADERP